MKGKYTYHPIIYNTNIKHANQLNAVWVRVENSVFYHLIFILQFRKYMPVCFVVAMTCSLLTSNPKRCFHLPIR
jgi:hypothetical protein